MISRAVYDKAERLFTQSSTIYCVTGLSWAQGGLWFSELRNRDRVLTQKAGADDANQSSRVIRRPKQWRKQ